MLAKTSFKHIDPYFLNASSLNLMEHTDKKNKCILSFKNTTGNGPRRKIVLISGADSDIGYEVATKLGHQEMIVYVGAKTPEKARVAAEKLETSGIDARPVIIDHLDELTIVNVAMMIEKAHGHLDVLVNSVGVIIMDDGLPSTTPVSVVKRTFNVNFIGLLTLIQTMLPLLLRARAARIVNISRPPGSRCLYGESDQPLIDTKLIGYNSTKAAIHMLTVQLDRELCGTPLRINTVGSGAAAVNLILGDGDGRPGTEGLKTGIGMALLAVN